MLGKNIVGHNLLFDLSWLMYKSGLTYAPNINTIDTMLLAHVSGERRLGLKHLSMMLGNFKGRRNTMTADESYLLEDLLATELLYDTYKSGLDTFAGKLVCNAVKAFAETKVKGLKLNEQRLFAIRDSYSSYDIPKYNFNVDSNRELSDYLRGNGVALRDKTERGDWKVDRPTLENFKDQPLVAEYLEYQAELNIYQKFIKPYCELQDFTIRPDIRLSGTETGRLSCSNPNVQQVPNRSLFKDIFRSRFGNTGCIATIDLDQAELRIAALLSGDGIYAKALLSEDFHRLVASKTFGKDMSDITKDERFVAKAVNFGGVLYGGSAKGIAARIKVESAVVATVQDWYAKEFVKLTQWIESEKDLAIYTNQITTLFGRVRKLDGLRGDQKRRIGVNTAVQSVASDVMLYIVTRLSSLIRLNKLQSQIMFPVHDELLLDIHKEEFNFVIGLLKQAFKDVLTTPIGQLELSKELPISGVLEFGISWLYLKNEKFPPDGSIKISSLGD
jgi:DNA polymerase I-like protein with 3'-5' exonuclease and polymerase domains